jgi:hypothetical protein
VECGSLLGVKSRKHPLFCGSECVLYLGQSARSCRREAHRVAAPVLWGGPALDEVRGFEVVEQADQDCAVHPHRFAEVRLALLAYQLKERQCDDLGRGRGPGVDQVGLTHGPRVPQVHHQQLLPRVQASALEEFARRGAVKPVHLAEGPAHGTARPVVEPIAARLLR